MLGYIPWNCCSTFHNCPFQHYLLLARSHRTSFLLPIYGVDIFLCLPVPPRTRRTALKHLITRFCRYFGSQVQFAFSVPSSAWLCMQLPKNKMHTHTGWTKQTSRGGFFIFFSTRWCQKYSCFKCPLNKWNAAVGSLGVCLREYYKWNIMKSLLPPKRGFVFRTWNILRWQHLF